MRGRQRRGHAADVAQRLERRRRGIVGQHHHRGRRQHRRADAVLAHEPRELRAARTAPSARPARRAGTRTAPGRCRPTTRATPARGSASVRGRRDPHGGTAERADHAVEQLTDRVVAQRHRLRRAGRARRELDDRLLGRHDARRVGTENDDAEGCRCDGDRRAGHDGDQVGGRHDRADPGRRDRARALGRGNARVQRHERAAGLHTANHAAIAAGTFGTSTPIARPARSRAAQVGRQRFDGALQLAARRRDVACVHDDVGRRSVEQVRRATRSRDLGQRPPIVDLGLAPDAHRAQRRVDDQRALHVGAERDQPAPPRRERGAVPRLLEARPTSPGRGSPRSTIASVSLRHRDPERPDAAAGPSASTADRPTSSSASRKRPIVADRGASPARARTRHPARPRRRAPRSSGSTARARRCGRSRRDAARRPPPTTRRATDPARRRPTSSCSKFAARPSQPSSSHMFTTSATRPVEPTVRPHAEAAHVAFFVADRAPVRGHVVHVAWPGCAR